MIINFGQTSSKGGIVFVPNVTEISEMKDIADIIKLKEIIRTKK